MTPGSIFRSSRPEVFCRKSVLRNSQVLYGITALKNESKFQKCVLCNSRLSELKRKNHLCIIRAFSIFSHSGFIQALGCTSD